MSADNWTPEGAPCPGRHSWEYTTFELEASARFAVRRLHEMPVDHPDRERTENWLKSLHDEDAKREGIARDSRFRAREAAPYTARMYGMLLG